MWHIKVFYDSFILAVSVQNVTDMKTRANMMKSDVNSQSVTDDAINNITSNQNNEHEGQSNLNGAPPEK